MKTTMKRIAAIVLVSVTALSIAACGKKNKSISAEDFKSKLEKEGYTVTDYGEDEEVTAKLTAVNKDHSVSIVYGKFANKDDAETNFQAQKDAINSVKSEAKEQGFDIAISSSEVIMSDAEHYSATILAGDTLVVITAEGSEDAVASAKDAKKALGL